MSDSDDLFAKSVDILAGGFAGWMGNDLYNSQEDELLSYPLSESYDVDGKTKAFALCLSEFVTSSIEYYPRVLVVCKASSL